MSSLQRQQEKKSKSNFKINRDQLFIQLINKKKMKNSFNVFAMCFCLVDFQLRICFCFLVLVISLAKKENGKTDEVKKKSEPKSLENSFDLKKTRI